MIRDPTQHTFDEVTLLRGSHRLARLSDLGGTRGMEMSEQSHDVDPAVWDTIYQALDKPGVEFRTVRGIARDTGLSEAVIEALLHQNPDRVRIAYAPDEHGNLLYTRRDRPKSLREILADIRTFAASSI